MAPRRVFILDRSGSMETCSADTIGGYNSFIRDQVEFGGTMTLIQFDHEILNVYEDVPIGEVVPLTHKTFTPRGSTALFDAIGHTIKIITDGDPPTIIILTDGHENASNIYTKSHVKDLIDTKTKDHGWNFVYLGANQDAFAVSGDIGIAPGCTLNFDSNRTPEAFRSLSAAISTQYQGLTPSPTFSA
jgi:hypothetical protein